MQIFIKICIVGILILSWSCFVEEIANYYFLYRGSKNRFRMFVFLAIGIMDAFLFANYFFFKLKLPTRKRGMKPQK